MYDELIERVKGIKPSAFSDIELERFFEEAFAKTCADGESAIGEGNTDDALIYYVLSQLSLFEGDLADYNNYCVLYNNAVRVLKRNAFEQLPSRSKENHYENLW